MEQEWDLIIVGGGIGGLSCAHFLRRAGMRVCVLERSAGLNEVGAGLQLAPNALAALREIDLLDELLPLGWKMQAVELRSTRSGLLSTVDLNEVAVDGDKTMLAIHRAQLQKVLARGLDADTLRFGVQIAAIEPDGDRVRVRLADGRTLESRLLIGADGLRSQVRSLLFPPVALRYSGTSSYRGIVQAPARLIRSAVSAEIWGPGCRFGYSLINATDIYWYLTFDAPAQEQRSAGASKEHALQLMANFPDELALVAATDPGHLIHTDITDIKPTAFWVQDRVALIGDAAHATTPNLGQGAAQALEDAWALGLAVTKFGTEPIALLSYNSVRESKALWIVKQSWSFQSICHIRKPWLQSLRDFFIRHAPRSLQESSLERIYKPEVGLSNM